MTTNGSLGNIEKLEKDLWEAADNLRANSKLTSSEYCMPVLGVIFLRHAANRFEDATREIEYDQKSGRAPKRTPIAADYVKRRCLYLPEAARYEKILATPKETDLGMALIDAMTAIEDSFEPLRGVLPRDFSIFERSVLEDLLKIFNRESLRSASGDVFGRIYEYFLMKFAMQGAQDNGEFFTPPSLVQTIVNVIEPDHGVVADLACGSGGMFVQSSHFIEDQGQDTMKRVTFYGQEKTATTIRLAKMNLAVHGLEGDIREANTFYDDVHRLPDGRLLWGNCDFGMANPPFNVDQVDAEKIKDDPRLPFGLPGVNIAKKVSNGNYLWISYFHSYLGPKGRAGFVMSSQASSAGHGEAEVRRRIVETGDVDVMISIRSNFFYTRTVPCELWFFDKGKPAEQRDTVLMLDARNIYRKVTRKVFDFSPEQLKNLTAIVWLYRGQRERFLGLVESYFGSISEECAAIPVALDAFDKTLNEALEQLQAFAQVAGKLLLPEAEKTPLTEALTEWQEAAAAYKADRKVLKRDLECFHKETAAFLPSTCGAQLAYRKTFDSIAEQIKGLVKQVDALYKLAARAGQSAETLSQAVAGLATETAAAKFYDRRTASKRLKQLMRSEKPPSNNSNRRSIFTVKSPGSRIAFPMPSSRPSRAFAKPCLVRKSKPPTGTSRPDAMLASHRRRWMKISILSRRYGIFTLSWRI